MAGQPYLHLGGDVVVRTRDIVGIFDMEKTTESAISRRFLADAEKGGRVYTVSYELPKAYVVTAEEDGSETVYITQVSAATLRRRMKKGMD
ncbi:MAG: DUF370 domain-containing protein [Ruminococcaceae bacterium]|nr:DUF370 domain-containing protein [Oscillospiraceae bacterium]